jgi:exopolysaccharide biosynthesis predicted pyruvyltransferase EpsI
MRWRMMECADAGLRSFPYPHRSIMLVNRESPRGELAGLLGTNAPCSVPLLTQDDPYVRFLVEHRRRKFYMKAYNGNSGDALIWLGSEQLLKDLQITRTMNPQAADIILIPGGNQTMWTTNVELWKEIWSRWPDKDFVVGPTTIRLGLTTWDTEVRQSKARIRAIFARDPESYAILEACGFRKDITIGLSHDPAFYLRSSELIRQHRAAATEDFILAAFRDDHEAALNGWQRWAPLADWAPACVSRRLRSHWKRANLKKRIAQVTHCTRATKPLRICDVSLCSFQFFLETVRTAAEVHTDRLHCMLLAALLGKPTFAYPTAYGKLEAVYAHSMKDWAQVEFVGGATPVTPTQERLAASAPRTDVCRQPAL